MVELIGASILATGITSYCILFQGADVYTALGVSGTFWLTLFLHWLMNGTHKKAGMPTNKLIPVMITCALSVFAGFAKPDWAVTWFTAMDAIYSLVALQEIFPTSAAGDFWGVATKDDPTMFLRESFGFFLLAYHIHSCCLCSGVDPVKAIAYGSLAGITYFLSSFFITKEVPAVTGKTAAYMYALWLGFFSIMTAAILL